MTSLNTLQNSSRPKNNTRRVGRGISSGKGKTCGRGQKGQGSRSGAKRRYGYEGGQFPLYRKLPTRGFTRGRFRTEIDTINLDQIEAVYNDGEIVNAATMLEHGFISGKSNGIKVLGNGELTKKVTIEVNAISEGAKEKLQKAKIPFTIIGLNEEGK